MALETIISGGQTGADQGALYAARKLCLKTGGVMPKGFHTEAGPNPRLAQEFGLREHFSSGYLLRTRENILLSDGTLIFGVTASPGSKQTLNMCRRLGALCHVVFWYRKTEADTAAAVVEDFRSWIIQHDIRVLNVAGNRENGNPGIHQAIREFLIEALGNPLRGKSKETVQ